MVKALRITADMIERRDFVKRLYGDRYESAVGEAKKIVSGIADRDGKTVVQAALFIANKAIIDGHGEAVSMIIAAAVELCEEKDRGSK
jgi:hypothetical protein